MADLSFAYANSRVKAMKSHLFDADRVRELMDVRSLSEFIELLEESPYKPHFVAASTRYRNDLELAKHALDDNLAWTLSRIAEIIPKKELPFYRVLLKQWEANNVKKIIASKAIGKPVALGDLLPVGTQGTLLSALVEAPDLKAALERLSHSDYAPAIRACADEHAKTGDFRVILAAVDRHYYSQLSEAAGKASDEFTRDFVADRLDFANAFVILRMMKSGVGADKIRPHVVSATSASRRLVNAMLSHPNAARALEVFARKKRVQLDAGTIAKVESTRGIAEVEVELEKALLARARRTLSVSVLSMGVVVAFLHLKQEEVHSLRKIAYATQFEVKDEIRQRVLSVV